MKKLIFTIVIVSLFFVSCGKEKTTNSTEPEMTRLEAAMTESDTLALTKLVGQYFDYLIDGHYYEAAAMLYHRDKSNNFAEPIPYTNEEMDEYAKTFDGFPIVEYSIDYIKISEESKNEVECSVIMMKGENGMPDVKTKVYFIPVRYMGTWLLTLANTDSSDRTIVDGDDRDSLTQRYEHWVEEKAEEKAKVKAE